MATRSAVAGSTFSSWANSRTLRSTKWRGFSSTGRNSSWRLGLSKPKVLARSGRWFCEPSELRFLGMWLHFYRINREVSNTRNTRCIQYQSVSCGVKRLLQISVGPYSKTQQLVQIVDKGADNSVSGGWICGVQGGGFSQVPCFLQANESASLLFLFGSSLALAR